MRVKWLEEYVVVVELQPQHVVPDLSASATLDVEEPKRCQRVLSFRLLQHLIAHTLVHGQEFKVVLI